MSSPFFGSPELAVAATLLRPRIVAGPGLEQSGGNDSLEIQTSERPVAG
jgi:hypothetical protein